MKTARLRLPSSRAARAQRGAMLLIALIVLVAMTLAGIATMRSVDTSAIVAGNIAFKESSMHAADQGIQAAHAWITSKVGTPDLYVDNNAQGANSIGYFSSAPLVDVDWRDPSNWSNAAALNGGIEDPSGNKVYYVIQRICAVPNCAPGATCAALYNYCALTPDSLAACTEGCDKSTPNNFTRPSAVHYRVTAKAIGPRNSVTIVQAHLRTP